MENSTILLALDLGTHTGWALRYPDGRIEHGTELFQPGRHEGGGMRYVRFRQRIKEFLKVGVGLVYYEEVMGHGKGGVIAAQTYGAFHGTLTAVCEEQGIPYAGVPVGTIKRHVTGKGNAGKEAVMAAMVSKGFNPEDDNAADALALLDFVMAQAG